MKKSRESSHYFSRQYPRRRQIRLPERLQISGTVTMPQGSSRWKHTMGAALCSGHGRRRLHSRQRQSPRSAGETSRAVFSSAPIAVFTEKRKNPRNRAVSRIFLELLGRFELPTSSLPKLRIKFYMVSVRVIKCPIIPLVPMPISILELFSIAPYCSVFSGLLEDLLEENIPIF